MRLVFHINQYQSAPTLVLAIQQGAPKPLSFGVPRWGGDGAGNPLILEPFGRLVFLKVSAQNPSLSGFRH